MQKHRVPFYAINKHSLKILTEHTKKKPSSKVTHLLSEVPKVLSINNSCVNQLNHDFLNVCTYLQNNCD